MTRTIFHIDPSKGSTSPTVQSIIVQAEKNGLKTRVLSEWAVEVICDDHGDVESSGSDGSNSNSDLCQERLTRIYANHPSVAIFYDHNHPRNGKLPKHRTHFRRCTDNVKDGKTMPRSLSVTIPGSSSKFGQTATFLSQYYNFPLPSTFSGINALNMRPTIAILSLGGTYLKSDCDAYWKILGFTGSQIPIIKNIVVSTNRSLSCYKLIKDLQKTTVGGGKKSSNVITSTVASIWDDWTISPPPPSSTTTNNVNSSSSSGGVSEVTGSVENLFPAFTGSSADMETTLDVQIAGGMCPGCTLLVYSVPNTSLGFYQGIYRIIKDLKALTTCPTGAYCGRAFSISWGAPESEYSVTEMHCINSMFADAKKNGIVICAASGDDGSTDGVDDQLLHVDFPAIAPNVISCGGTSLIGVTATTAAASVSTTGNEKAWTWTSKTRSGGGGGFSTAFKRPAYQAGLAIPYPLPLSTLPSSIPITADSRMSPDISLNADSRSGWSIYFNGQLEVSSYGGTSCVAPALAGYFAGLNLPIEIASNLHEILYAIAKNQSATSSSNNNGGCFRDIMVGSNDATERPGVSPLLVPTTTQALCFNTCKGYDLCTGLGVPDGTKLAAALMSYASLPPPPPPPLSLPSQSSSSSSPPPQVTNSISRVASTPIATKSISQPLSIVKVPSASASAIVAGMPVAIPKFDPGAARARAQTIASAAAAAVQPPPLPVAVKVVETKKPSFLKRVMGK